MNKKGYTLIEVIVSIMILSIASITLAGTFTTVIRFMSRSNQVKEASNAMFSYIEGSTDAEAREKVKVKEPSNKEITYNIKVGDKSIQVKGMYNAYYVDNDSDIELKNMINNKNLKVSESPAYIDIQAFAKDLLEKTSSYEINPEICTVDVLSNNKCDSVGFNEGGVWERLYQNKDFVKFSNDLLPEALKNQNLYISAFYPWEMSNTNKGIDHGGVLIYLGIERGTVMPSIGATEIINVIYDYDENVWYYNPSDIITLKYDYTANNGESNLLINGINNSYKNWSEFKASITKSGSKWLKLDKDKIYLPNENYWVSVDTTK